MGRLTIQLPRFSDIYDGPLMRELTRLIETTFQRIEVVTRRGAYTATTSMTFSDEDDVVMFDTSSGNITATLPEISEAMVKDRREFEVVKTAAANTLTIQPSGTNTVVGEPDAQVTDQWTALRLRATTGNWVLI